MSNFRGKEEHENKRFHEKKKKLTATEAALVDWRFFLFPSMAAMSAPPLHMAPAETPSESVTLMSAPRATRSEHISPCPNCAASMRGVRPSGPEDELIFAPPLKKKKDNKQPNSKTFKNLQ